MKDSKRMKVKVMELLIEISNNIEHYKNNYSGSITELLSDIFDKSLSEKGSSFNMNKLVDDMRRSLNKDNKHLFIKYIDDIISLYKESSTDEVIDVLDKINYDNDIEMELFIKFLIEYHIDILNKVKLSVDNIKTLFKILLSLPIDDKLIYDRIINKVEEESTKEEMNSSYVHAKNACDDYYKMINESPLIGKYDINTIRHNYNTCIMLAISYMDESRSYDSDEIFSTILPDKEGDPDSAMIVMKGTKRFFENNILIDIDKID